MAIYSITSKNRKKPTFTNIPNIPTPPPPKKKEKNNQVSACFKIAPNDQSILLTILFQKKITVHIFVEVYFLDNFIKTSVIQPKRFRVACQTIYIAILA